MTNRIFHKFISRFIEIKPGEGIISILLFSHFFLIMAPFYIIKPLRNAFYLQAMGAKKLPSAYLLTAILMGFIVALHSKLQVKISIRLLLIFSLIFFILTCLLFWLFFPYMWGWLAIAFWLWANIFIIVLVTQFWITVNEIFNPREVKRLIGFFGSGGILGGLAGGQLTGFLAKSNVDYNLLLLAAGMLIPCIIIVFYIFAWKKKRVAAGNDNADIKDEKLIKESTKAGFKDCFNTVRENNYLKLLATIVMITIIVSTLIDFQFNSIIEMTESLRGNLTAFYGHFFSILLAFSFFLQLLLTSNIIRHYGIRLTLLLYPLALLFCFPGAIFFINIYLAILLKSSDKSLSYSLNQSVRELIYIPISPEVKYKAKIFIDMFLNRFAKSIAAIILIILGFFNLGIKYVSFISVILILAWIVFNLRISKEYINNVKKKLEIKWQPAEKIVAEKMDVDYTKLVFDTLESKNRSSVLYAMHLFDLIKIDKLTPEVKKVISYKTDEVRISSLGNLFEEGETALFPEVDDFISDKVIEKEIKETMTLDVYQEVINKYVDNVLMNKGKKAELAKMEIAKAIGLMEPNSLLVPKLEELLQDESLEVIRYATQSARKLKRKEFVPHILQQLRHPSIKEDASKALIEYGEEIIKTLKDHLGDPEEDILLRKSIPDILAQIGSQEAADVLASELTKETKEMKPEIIEALYKMKLKNPQIYFQEKTILPEVVWNIKECYITLVEMHDLRSDVKKSHLITDLNSSIDRSIKQIFELLILVYPAEDIIKAYQNICTGTKRTTDYAIELLDNILKKEIKEILFPLIDDIPFEDKVMKCRRMLKTL